MEAHLRAAKKTVEDFQDACLLYLRALGKQDCPICIPHGDVEPSSLDPCPRGKEIAKLYQDDFISEEIQRRVREGKIQFKRDFFCPIFQRVVCDALGWAANKF